MKEKDILRFQGPYGSFFLREESTKPMILLAGGTGFAPIKALVEHAIHRGIARPMELYWGARNRAGLYLPELPPPGPRDHDHIRLRAGAVRRHAGRLARTQRPGASRGTRGPSPICRPTRSMPAAHRR
jgi:ferredoxin-NADP reductase